MKDRKGQTEPISTSQRSAAKEYFEQYWRYCSAVRNWFVAFGVGCCALLISEKAGIFKEVCIETKTHIVFWLLVGVVVQIVLALLNKYIHWCLYRGMEDKHFRKSWCYKTAEKTSERFWIDVLADILTIIAFTVAIWKMFGGSL